MIELTGATVRLGGKPVFSDVGLRVGAGQFVAVLGPNGAGKSTLMRVILGLVRLEAGSVTVLGRAPDQARSAIGYLPQRHGFDSSIRIRGVDLVRLGLDGGRWGLPIPLSKAARERHRAEAARVAETIALVGASGYGDRPIGELSGGEQQRLLIAQALVRDAAAADPRRAARQPRSTQPGRDRRPSAPDLHHPERVGAARRP